MDNLRSALSWAIDETGSLKIEAGLRLASALLNLWYTQTFQNEGYTWLNKGLSAAAGLAVDAGWRARACFAVGHLILPIGRTAEAFQWVQESIAIYTSSWCKKRQKGIGCSKQKIGFCTDWIHQNFIRTLTIEYLHRYARPITARFPAITPQPIQHSNPDKPWFRQRPKPCARLSTLIRPSTPACHFRPSTNHS